MEDEGEFSGQGEGLGWRSFLHPELRSPPGRSRPSTTGLAISKHARNLPTSPPTQAAKLYVGTLPRTGAKERTVPPPPGRGGVGIPFFDFDFCRCMDGYRHNRQTGGGR